MTDQEIGNNYFIELKLKGIVQPKVNHSNPEDYGLTPKWGYERRIKFWKEKRKPVQERLDRYISGVMRSDGNNKQFYMRMWKEEKDELDKIDRNIKYVTKLMGEGFEYKSKSYDVESLRRVPIDTIVSVNNAGFFALRDEKTPSCKWYRDSNVFVDFGGDNKKHDVIDLVMIINKCNFQEACKILGGCM